MCVAIFPSKDSINMQLGWNEWVEKEMVLSDIAYYDNGRKSVSLWSLLIIIIYNVNTNVSLDWAHGALKYKTQNIARMVKEFRNFVFFFFLHGKSVNLEIIHLETRCK